MFGLHDEKKSEGRGFPRVDDHLVVPEETREEIIGGVRYECSPADAPHGIQNSELDYVVRAHVARGYRVANDLLTRFDEDSDFASDTAVLRDGIDPETGARYLEEIAFEVVSKQNASVVDKKVPRMLRRGVRRIFAVLVKKREVREWSVDDDAWLTLAPESTIEDPCLDQPIEVRALLDAAAADDAVVRALAARKSPAIRELETKSRAEGKANAVLTILETRNVPVDDETRSRILACADHELLDRWLEKAVFAAAASEVVG